MRNLKVLLKDKLNKAQRIGLLGVGSEFRGDDVAGVLVAKSLAAKIKNRKFKVFLGETAPENLTGEIKKFKPTHLLIIDAADIGRKAGSVTMLCAKDIAGATFSTHRLPLKMLAEYFRLTSDCAIFIIAIQPKSIKVSDKVCDEVKVAAKKIKQSLNLLIKEAK